MKGIGDPNDIRPPITFAGVSSGDLLAGIRGVWELGRTELLADAFAARKP